MLRGKSHLFLHLSGALVAVAVACAIPAFSVFPTRSPLAVAGDCHGGRCARHPSRSLCLEGCALDAGAATLSHSAYRGAAAGACLQFPIARQGARSRRWRSCFGSSWMCCCSGRCFAPRRRAIHGEHACPRHGALALASSRLHFTARCSVIVLRHLRLFWEPVPGFVTFLEQFDVATEMFLPKVHVTSLVFPLALALLLGRRLLLMRVRYISLAADYFPLLASLGHRHHGTCYAALCSNRCRGRKATDDRSGQWNLGVAIAG
jgi:hypothetical protein